MATIVFRLVFISHTSQAHKAKFQTDTNIFVTPLPPPRNSTPSIQLLSCTINLNQHENLGVGRQTFDIFDQISTDAYAIAQMDDFQSAIVPFIEEGGQLLNNGCLYVPLP